MAVAEGRTRAEPEQPALVRCSSGLGCGPSPIATATPSPSARTVAAGKSFSRETFCAWWLARFSPEECAAIARAIWGAGRPA